MRVLHVYRTYFPDTQGGLEEAIRQICASTKVHGVENRVFMLSRNPRPEIINRPEAQVHRFPLTIEIASCGFSARCLHGFKELIAWADVVHYHFPWPFADMLHFVCRVKKPSILTYQSDIIRQQGLLLCYRPLMKSFLSRVDRIVATSPNYASSSEVLQIFSKKVDIIPIGLDRSIYPKVDTTILTEVSQQYGSGFFLFIGVLRYYKGLHILLQASQNADFKVVIAGTGPVESALKEQAQSLGLNNVYFAGFVSDEIKVALFHLALAVVFPSYLRSEAFGVTLVEGAMFKKPLISAEIGSGMSYINVHGSTGLTVAPNDVKSLRTAMIQLYQDQKQAEQMGQQAYQRYQKLFTGSCMGTLYTDLYTDILH